MSKTTTPLGYATDGEVVTQTYEIGRRTMNDWNENSSAPTAQGLDELQSMLPENFDTETLADEWEAGGGGGVVDPGIYGLRIVSGEIKATSSGGKRVELVTEIAAPDGYSGKIWDSYNLINPSEKAVEIAQKRFAALSRALGFPNGHRPSLAELAGRTYVGELSFVPGDPKPNGGFYGAKNEIVDFWKKGDKKPIGAHPDRAGTVDRYKQSMAGASNQAAQGAPMNNDDIPF